MVDQVNKKRKSRIAWLILFTLLLAFIIIPSLPLASASGQDATFDSIAVNAIPPIQGVGGEVKIIATAKFFGGCCYHLFAHDVEAELSGPSNISIVSSLPKTIDTIDAVPGGSPTSKDFKWTVISNDPGTFILTIKVSTSNCGSKTETLQISIIQAPSISNPSIFPSKPSVGEQITFSADALSGSVYVDVENTTLYVWGSTIDYDVDKLMAIENNLFIITSENTSNTSQKNDSEISKKFLGTGNKFSMSHVQFTDTWRIRVNDFKDEENIYFWFNIETTDEKNITSFITKQPIEDLEKKYQMLDAMIWGSFFVITLGIILILGVSWTILNRPAKKIGKRGVFLLGSSVFSKPSEGERTNVSETYMARIRYSLLFIFIILTILMVLLSIYLGLFQDIITETGG